MFQEKRLKSLFQSRMAIGILAVLFLIPNNTYCIGEETEPIHPFEVYQTMHGMIIMPPTNGGLLFLYRVNGEMYPAVQYDINLDLNFNIALLTPKVRFLPSYDAIFSTADATSTAETDTGPVTTYDTALRTLFGVSGYFLGSYDFRVWDMYSQPIIAKRQNPQVELYVDGVYPSGFLKYHVGVGVAHESNGQYVETLTDFQHLSEIDESLCNQAFASMGSNYLAFRGAYAITDQNNTIKQNILCLEYRLYFPDLADDLNITSRDIHDGGLRAYDGIRFGVDHYAIDESCTRIRLILPTNFANDYLGKGYEVLPFRSGLEITWISLDRAWPVFYTFKFGSSTSLAYYFVPSASVAFGITLPTSISVNKLSSELKTRFKK